ncbi:MFS transporter, partial [Klebsiella pneumoniae]
GLLGLHGWQWMFIVEAVPAVILGVVVLFYLTDRPEKATWLADDQRAWLVAEMDAERAGKRVHAKHGLMAGITDIRVLALALIYFGTSAGLY